MGVRLCEPTRILRHQRLESQGRRQRYVEVRDWCVVQWLLTLRSRDGSPSPSPPGSTVLYGDRCTRTALLALSPLVWKTANSSSGTQQRLWNIQSRKTPMAHTFLNNLPFFASVPRKPSSRATPFIRAQYVASISTASRQTFCCRCRQWRSQFLFRLSFCFDVMVL